MKITYYTILLITLLINSCAGQSNETNLSDKSRYEKWILDLDYFENEYLPDSKTFSEDSIIVCKERLSELRLKIDSLNDNQIILELSKCVSMANNGHTTINLGWMDKIPVRLFWFSDGLYVVKTDSLNSKYLGCRVSKINSIKVEDLQSMLNPYLSGIDSWKKYMATNYLCSPQVLNGVGLATEDSLNLTLSTPNDTMDVVFKVKQIKDRYKYSTWTNLLPNENKDDWVHVLKSNNDLPTYLREMNRGVFYEFIEDKKIAYFSINELWYKCQDFKGKINEFNDSLKKNTDYNVVIDLRYFAGGNFMIPLKIATEPPKIIDSDKKIYLITGTTTFSAGLVTAARVKYFAKDKIIVLGEQVGDKLKFWAEGKYYKLPNSKITIQDSKYQHDWEDDKFIPFRTYFFNLFLGVPAKDLNVDKEIKLSFENYINYKDPVMDWIIKQ